VPTAAERLVGIRLKIERAKYHIADLDRQIVAFRQTNPYRISPDPNPQNGEKVFRFHVDAEPDSVWSLIAGEAAHQLRSALDHLAWQLVEANKQTPGTWTYFPIYETLAMYKAKASGKVKGIASGAISLIESVQPYQSGYELLRKLHEIDNFAKHRLLLLVGCAVYGVGWGGREPLLDDSSNESLFDQIKKSIGWVPYDRSRAIIENGTELARLPWCTASKMNDDLYCHFEIAFRQPQIVKAEPILHLLPQLASLVERIVQLFVRYL
jgi:hypothetical protein